MFCSGCIWVSAAADFGAEGVLERYVQLGSINVIKQIALTSDQVRASTPNAYLLGGCCCVRISCCADPIGLNGDILRYNAKVHPHLPKLKELLRGLSDRVALQPKVVIIHHPAFPAGQQDWEAGWSSFDDFVRVGQDRQLGRTPDGEIAWARLPFDWPLWILFSSGTTGARSSTAM